MSGSIPVSAVQPPSQGAPPQGVGATGGTLGSIPFPKAGAAKVGSKNRVGGNGK